VSGTVWRVVTASEDWTDSVVISAGRLCNECVVWADERSPTHMWPSHLFQYCCHQTPSFDEKISVVRYRQHRRRCWHHETRQSRIADFASGYTVVRESNNSNSTD